MTPPRVATEPKYTVAYPALQLPWVVRDPVEVAQTAHSSALLSRRDVLKLATVGLMVSTFLTACGGAVGSPEATSQNANNEIPIPNPEAVPGFSRPVRPWILDLESGLVIPATAEIGREVANTFSRWIDPARPLVELHNQMQMVVRAPNNTGTGAELGYETQYNVVDLQSERARNGFSLTDRAKGEQYVRPGSDGFLTSYMDYMMTGPNPSDGEVRKLVNKDMLGDQHFLKDKDGNNFALPGNASQVLNLMQMVNYLYAKVVNDNIFGLSNTQRFEQFYTLKDRFISDILLIPTNGESQVRNTAINYLNSLGASTSDPNAITTLLDEIEPMIRTISKVDAVSVPSAQLAVSIAASLVNAEVSLSNDGISPERSAKLQAISSYAKTDLQPDAVVAFDQERAIEQAVENEWQRIPLSKPRAFEVIVQKYEEKSTETGKVENNAGYERKVIFSSFTGDSVARFDKDTNGVFDPLFTHPLTDIGLSDLRDQKIIESEKKDSIFFNIEREVNGLKSGQRIVELKEIDSSAVRLFVQPEGKMNWGIHTAKSGMIPMNLGDQVYALFGSENYNKIPYEEIIMEDGTYYKSSINSYFQAGWATDITDRWLEWKKAGLKEVTKMGLLTPDQYLARLSQGSMFQPQGQILSNTLLGRYAMMDVTNNDLDSLKTNSLIAALDDLPLYQVSGEYGQQVDFLARGDVVTCDYNIIMVNDQPMIKLFDSGGLQYAVPIDFQKLQMIDNGTRDRIIETAKDWLPIALLLIPYGKGISKGARSLLKLFLK